MATDINHDTIKSAIVTILTANEGAGSAIYDISGGSNKLRSILVGYPHGGDPLQDTSANFAFVTNENLTEELKPAGAVVSNAMKAIMHTIRYQIVFVMQDETPRKTEVIMDTIQQGIMELLEADHDLGGTVHDSYPERVETMIPEKTAGRTKQGRKITLRCTVITGD